MVENEYVNPDVPQRSFSKKVLKQLILPSVGTDIMGCKVIYSNDGRLQITVEGPQHLMPSASGLSFMHDSKVFEIVSVKNNRYNAVFRGYKQNSIVDAPEEVHDEEIVKVI